MKIKLRLIDVLLKVVLYSSAVCAVMILLFHMESYDMYANYNVDGKALGLMFYVCVLLVANALHNECIRDNADLQDYTNRLEDSLDSLMKINAENKKNMCENN